MIKYRASYDLPLGSSVDTYTRAPFGIKDLPFFLKSKFFTIWSAPIFTSRKKKEKRKVYGLVIRQIKRRYWWRIKEHFFDLKNKKGKNDDDDDDDDDDVE